MSFIPPREPPAPHPPSFDEDRPAVPPALVRGRPFPLHPSFGWAILWSIGLLLVTMTPGIIVALGYIFFVMIVFPDAVDQTRPLMDNFHVQVGMGLGIWIPHVLIILVSLTVLRVLVGRDWPREVALRLPSASHALLVVLLTPAVIVLAEGVMVVLRDGLGLPTMFDPKKAGGMGDVEKLFNSWPVAVAVFVIAVMPALSEELWCRAFLGRGLVGIHGYVAGVLMTSFLFGLIHLDPCQGLMAMSMGVVLHFVYLTTRSLAAPMMLHFLNNATSVVLSREEWDFGPSAPSAAFAYAAAVAVLAAVGYALYESRARLAATDGGVAWRPPHPGVVCPPRGSHTVVVAPRPSALAASVVFAALAAFGAALAAALAGK